MNLLLVDYDLNSLKVMCSVFELWGYFVTVCTNKYQVKKAMNEKLFDAIVTELNIPGSVSGEVISYMREKQKNIPIIVLTENHSIRSAIRAMKNGANEILQKPIKPDQIRKILTLELSPQH